MTGIEVSTTGHGPSDYGLRIWQRRGACARQRLPSVDDGSRADDKGSCASDKGSRAGDDRSCVGTCGSLAGDDG